MSSYALLWRLAGIIAALLYGTAAAPVYYSRFIWQQNLIAAICGTFFVCAVLGCRRAAKRLALPGITAVGVYLVIHETTICWLPLASFLAGGCLAWASQRLRSWRRCDWASNSTMLDRTLMR